MTMREGFRKEVLEGLKYLLDIAHSNGDTVGIKVISEQITMVSDPNPTGEAAEVYQLAFVGGWVGALLYMRRRAEAEHKTISSVALSVVPDHDITTQED